MVTSVVTTSGASHKQVLNFLAASVFRFGVRIQFKVCLLGGLVLERLSRSCVLGGLERYDGGMHACVIALVLGPAIYFSLHVQEKPLLIGGSVAKPERTHFVQPIYPGAAEAGAVQSLVILEMTVDRAGNVSNVKPLRGADIVVPAAVEAWSVTLGIGMTGAVGLVFGLYPAMRAARLLAPQPGQTVLDLCAAPGIKTTHLAELMRNQGSIIATDVQPERLARIEQNSQVTT